MPDSLSSDAASSTQRLIVAGSCPGWRSRQSAAVPATWGEAIEVPLSVVDPPERRAEVISTPGAKSATHSPVLEKDAPRSLRSEAPVESDWSTRDGDEPQAFADSLPAATA